jgi:hypothetical protein
MRIGRRLELLDERGEFFLHARAPAARNPRGSALAAIRIFPGGLRKPLPLSETMHAFVGTGVNHTLFFDEKTGGPLEDSKLTLDDSIGLAFDLGNDLTLNLDARYIDIDTDAELNGTKMQPWRSIPSPTA